MNRSFRFQSPYIKMFLFGIFISGSCCNAYAQENAAETFSGESALTVQEIDSVKGKTAMADSTWNIGWFPVIFYSNETRLAGGGGVQLVKKGYTERHASSIGIIAYYTQNKQYSIGANTVIFFERGAYKAGGEIAYYYFPEKFYGIGNNTSKNDEEKYITRSVRFRPIFQKMFFSSNLFIGFNYDYAHFDVLEKEPGKILDRGSITGSEGGLASGIGIYITWDARDNNLYPTSGSYHQLITGFYGPSLGSDFNFNIYLADLRHYLPLFDDHVLAFRGVAGINSGDPPFQMIYFTGSLGAFLRGYTQSRFMDKSVVTFEAEYRLPLVWRFGLVGFAGIGQVAPKISQMSLNQLKPSAGFGIRFALIPEQNVNVRIDMGVGKDDASFNINLMEAF